MSILDDWAPYQTPSGLISGKPNQTVNEGNAILRTAQYVMCLAKNGALTEQIKADVIYAICVQCEIRPGLYRRCLEWKQDQIGRDDMIGLACIGLLCNVPFSKYVLWWGGGSSYSCLGFIPLPGAWDNVAGDEAKAAGLPAPRTTRKLAAWLGRHVEMITFHEFVATNTPSYWHRYFLQVSLANAGGPTDQDGWILGTMMCDALEILGVTDDIVLAGISKFKARMLAGPGRVNAVFADYFGNAEHPLVKWYNPLIPRLSFSEPV